MKPYHPAFSPEEYQSRLENVRRSMECRSLEVLIVSDPSNMAWLTGYDGWSFYVHQCVVVTLQDAPLWYVARWTPRGRYGPPGSRNRTSSIIPMNTCNPRNAIRWTISVVCSGTASSETPGSGWKWTTIIFSAAAYTSLLKHLPNASFDDATGLVNWCRAVKSEEEIEFMRRAARIVEHIHTRILDQVEPGIRKCDLVAEIYDASIRGTAEYGGDYPAIVPLLPSGTDAAASPLTWDDRPMKKGEATFFEIAGCYRRYHVPLCRTVFLGQPSREFLDADQAVLEGLEAGLEQARPGNRCEDIAIAFFDVLEKHGIHKDSRTGYSIGLSYPPDWGERTMSLRRGDLTELEPGMTFHFMTGIWQENWGLETTESILITAAGVECLASFPRQLFVKD